jgi:hypothetical protein
MATRIYSLVAFSYIEGIVMNDSYAANFYSSAKLPLWPKEESGQMICEKFETCSFFQKYENELGSTQYQLLVENYCHGALMRRCARLIYEKEKGEKPPVNFSPIGEYM